jgi:hypothetical protein
MGFAQAAGFGMRAAWVAAAMLLALGAPAELDRDALGETVPAGYPVALPPPVINSPVFAVRLPPPGRPGYLATIKFIDDGLRYVDPLAGFFVSPAGELCFHTRPDYPTTIYQNYYRDWCLFPQTVDRVEAAFNPTINEVRLWCRRAFPQCAHSLADGRIADDVSAPTLDYRQERDAIEALIYMMGGYARPPLPPEALSEAPR